MKLKEVNWLNYGFLTAAQPNSDDDGIAGNDDKNDDETIDDDYYCFIWLLKANACQALPSATCCIFIFKPDDNFSILLELHEMSYQNLTEFQLNKTALP